MFRLASAPVVVRVARGEEWLPKVRAEVAVSRWLEEEGFPATRLVEDLDQPLLIDGYPVTFWHLIVEGDRKATYGELGCVLRDLHSMTVPAGLELPRFDPFGKQQLRIDRAAIPEDDRTFLRKRWHELRAQYSDGRPTSSTRTSCGRTVGTCTTGTAPTRFAGSKSSA